MQLKTFIVSAVLPCLLFSGLGLQREEGEDGGVEEYPTGSGAGLNPVSTESGITINRKEGGPNPKSQWVDLKPNSQWVGLKPKSQWVDLKPKSQWVDLKPNSQWVGLKPKSQWVDLKPNSQWVDLKPKSQWVDLKPNSQWVGLKPKSQWVDLKPNSQWVDLKPKSQWVDLKPKSQWVGLKPKSQWVDLKPKSKAAGLNPKIKAARPNLKIKEAGFNPKSKEAGLNSKAKEAIVSAGGRIVTESRGVQAGGKLRNDTPCTSVGGICQRTTYICLGRYLEDRCAGPRARQCCVSGPRPWGTLCSSHHRNRVRGCDAFGCGAFGSNRGGQSHRAVDVVCDDYSVVNAPFQGTLDGPAEWQGSNGIQYDGVKLSNSEFCVKILNVRPYLYRGGVSRGEALGYLLPLQDRFSGITSHLRLQTCDLSDPSPFI